MTRRAYAHGSGPGPLAPDGCSVEFYALLQARGEPELIHNVVGAGRAILELGSGAGRVTHPLLALGHEVVAVDESAEMLAQIKGAETVCSPIESLALNRRFDAVVLISYLIEVPDDHLMRAFLYTCRSHVRDDGFVILERHPPEWHDNVTTYEFVSELGHIVRMRRADRPERGVVSATVEYEVGDKLWTHSFVTRHLSDERLASELDSADLVVANLLTPDGRWVVARPRHKQAR